MPDADRVWDMVEKIDLCMFVTKRGESFHGRPMSSIVLPARDAIYFLTDKRAAKDDELRANPHVHLGYASGQQYLSVNGKAATMEDRLLIKELWTPSAQAFWPDGPDDPNIVAIKVAPDEAEYWDGPNGIVAGVKMAFAVTTGQKPDLGDNAKVKM